MTTPERKQIYLDNVKTVQGILFDAGYRCGHNMHGTNGDIEFYVGPGCVPVIALQYYKDFAGIELWAPLSQTNVMEDSLRILRDCVANSK